MSRVGRAPIKIDDKVQVTINPESVIVKGPKQSQEIPVNKLITVKLADGEILLTRENDQPKTRAFHGLYRALINNAVLGVTTGWSKNLELNGVGYRASVSGQVLELNLGYSHPIKFDIPKGIEIKVEKQTKVAISGHDKCLVGQVAAKVRSFRPPEPYLGKGVKYADEYIKRKAGKSAGK